MKELLLGFIGMLLGGGLMAQTLSQFFGQNKRQLRELGEQIAALRALTGTLEEGTRAVGARLDTVGTVKQGDLALHSGYYESLLEVKPVVSAEEQVGAIMMMGEPDDIKWLLELLQNGTLKLSDAERLYRIEQLYKRVKDEYFKTKQS